MYAYITLNEWIIWVKTHNNEFSSFLSEVGTPYIVGAKERTIDDIPGFFVPILPGWCIRYNRNLIVRTTVELIELRISEFVHTD
jgi:hypothetical protein